MAILPQEDVKLILMSFLDEKASLDFRHECQSSKNHLANFPSATIVLSMTITIFVLAVTIEYYHIYSTFGLVWAPFL